MSDGTIHDCEVKYYKMKIAELEAKYKDLEDTVKFFKKQAQELRYQKDDLIWQNDAFRKREATRQENMRKAEEHAAWLDYRVQSLLSMEATWLGDKRRAETYALALEEQENISWAESQILIDELKKKLKTKDGQLDAMRTLNDSMEDMLSQTKKKLENTKKDQVVLGVSWTEWVGMMKKENDILKAVINRIDKDYDVDAYMMDHEIDAFRDAGTFMDPCPENVDAMAARKLREMKKVLPPSHGTAPC